MKKVLLFASLGLFLVSTIGFAAGRGAYCPKTYVYNGQKVSVTQIAKCPIKGSANWVKCEALVGGTAGTEQQRLCFSCNKGEPCTVTVMDYLQTCPVTVCNIAVCPSLPCS